MFLLDAQTPPSDNSVVAGPLGFTFFILLIIAVALLCWSFTKQLKKVEKARAEGVFGPDESEPDQPEQAEQVESADPETEPHDTGA